jgi:hypothetical protein
MPRRPWSTLILRVITTKLLQQLLIGITIVGDSPLRSPCPGSKLIKKREPNMGFPSLRWSRTINPHWTSTRFSKTPTTRAVKWAPTPTLVPFRIPKFFSHLNNNSNSNSLPSQISQTAKMWTWWCPAQRAALNRCYRALLSLEPTCPCKLDQVHSNHTLVLISTRLLSTQTSVTSWKLIRALPYLNRIMKE